MDPKRAANRRLWDAWTPYHVEAEMYDVAGFRRGASSLCEVERRELGELSGVELLHLQCHFGLDTLSLARLGANVTGVDFSATAIERARGLAGDCGIDATFVESDLYELALGPRFDLVFTSYGVLWWLEDLDRWAAIVERHLAPGGSLYLVEFHPQLFTLDDEGRPVEPYLGAADAIASEERGSYAAPDAPVEGTSYGWHHDLGSIVTAIAGAGMRVEFLHEHPYSPYDCFGFCEPSGAGRFRVRGMPEGAMPMLFSLKATSRPVT